MTESPNPKLTDGQKDCLRLAGRLFTSKEIGRELRISPFTVDQRLDAARRKLGARTRKDAARVFAEMDEIHIYQPLVYETPEVADRELIAEQPGNKKTLAYKMDRSAAMTQPLIPPSLWQERHHAFSMSLPALGGREHELKKLETFSAIVKVAMFSVITMSFIVALMISVMTILSGLK